MHEQKYFLFANGLAFFHSINRHFERICPFRECCSRTICVMNKTFAGVIAFPSTQTIPAIFERTEEECLSNGRSNKNPGVVVNHHRMTQAP